MKVLLDENQVGKIVPGNPPSVQIFNTVASNGQDVLAQVVNPPQFKPGEKPVMGFPNVRTCQGVVVVMKDGTMFGAHVPTAKDEARLLQQMKTMIDQNGSGIASMYVARRDRSKNVNYGMEPEDKAKTLGFTGKLHTFDTGVANEKNEGVYVQFTPSGKQGKCMVEYKKDEKMAYTTPDVATNVIDPKTQKVRFTLTPKTDAQLGPDSNASKLHQAKVKSVKVK